ncbi:MAG TPA: BTAD domain-containing putative transcriptional regulator [Actinophytocola sp.]|nr:BTAD domain-containing putative transcriptional regulator [Actinophytocola sp.]
MGEVRYRLLGPMEVSIDGEAVKLPGSAERALMAQLLLVPGRTIAATMLVDRLWSESTLPVDPMNALQIRVSKLRRALTAVGVEGVVERDGVGYRASVDPTQVDAVDFERRLRAARAAGAEAAAGQEYSPALLGMFDDAIALWRGEPLSDFTTEHWAIAEATRLTELRLAAVTERAQVALALGRHREVAADLEPVVAEDPTLESVAGLLMVALYRSGRQADALEVYTRTRALLDESLGLEPSVSLRSLHERVLRQDESLGAQPEMAPLATVPVPSPRARASADPGGATNLPTVLRPLIGRDAQLDSLAGLVSQVRLLTLIGPGGAGKTSLALAAVARTAQEFPDGAFGVRLASVNAPDQVPVAVADALGVPLDGAAGARDIRERLIAYLGRKQLLVLVDNCEHVVDAAATLIEDILASCPQVTVLATSREALAIPDEVQVPVGPLDAPPEGTAARQVLAYPAAQLFVERARAVRPGSVYGEPDLAAIGRICRALDGIPLAVELAAARTAALSPVEISDRLEDRFSLLTSGARTAEARQQTLRAAVDWSYDLLAEQERQVFNRLSVFSGGWNLTAAEAVVADEDTRPGDVLDVIGRLVERSMLVVDPGPTTRYRMLETLRQYAAEQLTASGEAETLAWRHAEYFRDVALEAEMGLRGHGQRAGLDRLRADQPNLRVAVAWLAGGGGDLDSALAMAGALGLFWHLGRHLEGRELLARLLATGTGSPAARASALQAVSLVERPRACLVHPSPRCAETAAESLELFEQLGDPSRAALSRVLLAVQGVTGADPERSEELLREAEDQFMTDTDAGTDADVWGAGVIGFVRMETALKTGDETNAIPIGRAAATRFRHLDDPWGLSAILYHLGWGLRQFGRYPEAARVLEEAIDVAASAGLYNTVQWALADLGVTQLHLGDEEAARDLFDRAAAASQQVGDGAGEVLSGYGYGLLAQVHEDWTEARARFTEAEPGFGKLATPVPEGLAIAGLARCDEADGALDTARAEYERALEMGRRVGEPGLVATALEGLARLATQRGGDDARELLAEAADVRRRGARPAAPHEQRDLERAGLRAD